MKSRETDRSVTVRKMATLVSAVAQPVETSASTVSVILIVWPITAAVGKTSKMAKKSMWFWEDSRGRVRKARKRQAEQTPSLDPKKSQPRRAKRASAPESDAFNTGFDPLRGDTSLAFGGKGKKPEDKERFQIAPADSWDVDPDTGKKPEQ